MPSPSTRRSAYDLAVAQLNRLFPGSSIVRKLNKTKPAPAAVKTVNVMTTIASARCSEKACVYPSYSNGKCRQHLSDALATASTLPSTSGPMTQGRLVA